MLIRPIEAADKDFVFDSFFKSWRKSEYAGTIPNHLYYDVMVQLVEGLIGRGAKVDVAVEGDTILGWIMHEVSGDGYAVVHYYYVKQRYETFGIFQKLLDKVEGKKPGFITHKLRLPGYRHAPEIARRLKA